MHECQNCKSNFEEKPNCTNKYCSQQCYLNARWGDKRPWAGCSNCLASIGFGKRITGQILGIKPCTVLIQRKRDGIKTNTPPMGSWYMWAKRKANGKNPDRKRTACEVAYDEARMDDIKQAHIEGYTWGYIWAKEKSRRFAMDRYNNMTPVEKKEYNAKCMRNKAERWANDPLTKQRELKVRREWRRHRMKTNPQYRIISSLRTRLSALARRISDGDTHTRGSINETISCSSDKLFDHVSSQFDSKMNWENYGSYWELDHIVACASFNQDDQKHFELCWHYENFQPLEARENRIKSDSFRIGDFKQLITRVATANNRDAMYFHQTSLEIISTC